MTTRESLHARIDELPDSLLDDVEQSIDRIVAWENSPLREFLDAAPYDDEPLTDEDRAAIEAGLADIEAGRVVPHSVVEKLAESWATKR